MIAMIWGAIGGPRIIGYLAAGAVAILTIGGAILRLKASGRAEQRAADAAKTLEIKDAQIRIVRPDDSELDKRLRDGTF